MRAAEMKYSDMEDIILVAEKESTRDRPLETQEGHEHPVCKRLSAFLNGEDKIILLSSQDHSMSQTQASLTQPQLAYNVGLPVCKGQEITDLINGDDKIVLLSSQDHSMSQTQASLTQPQLAYNVGNNGHNEEASNAEMYQKPVTVIAALPETRQTETLTLHASIENVAQGSTHQLALPVGGDAQSTLMSAAAIAMAAFVGLTPPFTTHNIDAILNCGNNAYVRVLQGNAPRFIAPNEIPSLSLICYGVKINISSPVPLHSSFYPVVEANLSQIINRLQHDSDNKVGYMFTGEQKTVAFWKTCNATGNDIYYVFNSHGVGVSGLPGLTNLNKARLFQTADVHLLCSFLTMSTACDQGIGEYSIHSVKVISCQPLPAHYSCVAAGTKNQQNMTNGSNMQCVVMSACANALSIANGGIEFTTQEIDSILDHGNDIYINQVLHGGTARFIEPEEVPNTFVIGEFKIDVTTPEWVHSDIFPTVANDSQAILDLSKSLNSSVFDNNYSSVTGVFFTGQNNTISFWRDRITTVDNSNPTAYTQAVYYLFNSHAVNEKGVHDAVESKNKARLFKLYNLASLAALLIKDRIFNGTMALQEYTIHKMTINFEQANLNVEQVVSDSDSAVATTSTTTDGDWTLVTKKKCRPEKIIQGHMQQKNGFAILNVEQFVSDTDLVVTTTSTTAESKGSLVTRKRGRPKKVKRGASKQKKTVQSILNVEQIVSDSDSSVATTSTTADGDWTNMRCRPEKIEQGPTHMQQKNAFAILNIEQIDSDADVEHVSNSDLVVVTTSSTAEGMETLVTRKRGRPKKIKRGASKQKKNAQTKNVEQVVSDSDSIVSIESTTADEESIQTTKNQGRSKKVKQGATNQKKDAHLEASSVTYNQSHPEVDQEAVEHYISAHQEASQRYRENHREQVIEANRRYNTEDRNIPPPLRRGGLICEKSGEELDTVTLFALKKTSLQAGVTCSMPDCKALLFEEETSRIQWCCGQGRYCILNLPPIGEQFYNDSQFLRNSRAYNNLFAFSALGTSGGWQHPPTGISFIKVQGRIYHRMFDLSYSDTTNNINLYIDDGIERQRLAANQSLSGDLVREITNYLHEVNPFIECFKRLSREPSEQAHLIFEHTTRRTHGNILGDMPRGTEVAAILSTENERYVPKSIAIWKIGDARPHTVDIFHPLYESFQFPLLYPHGGTGWTINTRDRNNNKLSQVKYYRKLLLSEPRFSQLGRLSDEWLVDMYCRVEEERLRFISNKQKQGSNNQLRSAPLNEVVQMNVELAQDETIQAEGGVQPGRVYLPNTFTNSPRYMQCKYMDSIAIVNRLGKPSYFLTMTCNPKWVEIQNSTTTNTLSPPSSITARVFRLKLFELLKDLRNRNWFGGIIYILYVIEFQKRGLPHAHICYRVEGGGPVQNTEIDRVIRADIPPENEAGGRLRQYVLKHMIHGPCGRAHRTDLPCWDDAKGKCAKYFPKAAIDTTYVDEKGFVHLKRNAENTSTITFRNRSVAVNDQWVVPYNAALLLKYDCHMNLEVASTRKVVKYLFKYLTKGPDEARVAIVPDALRNDEVEQYVTRRYVGACDAAWRMLEFNVTSREPNVTMLPVHTENRQTIFFRPGGEADAVERANSDLLKYFNRPAGPEFDALTYQDFYENYLIHTTRPRNTNAQKSIYEICDGKYFVTKRQRGQMVARLFWVPPNRGEQFYLRLLLTVHPCRGFDDLRALGGTECRTFQEAARAVGLADDQLEYHTCLQEAATMYTAQRLRYFFVLLITNDAPGAILWESFKNALSENYLEMHSGSHAANEIAYRQALLDIDRLLRKHGSCLADHGLPVVEDDTTELGRERDEYGLQASTRLHEFTELWLPQLSPEQRCVFEHVNSILMNGNDEPSMAPVTEQEICPTAIFLDGPSGTGKTLLLNVIVAHVRGVLKRVAICTASSGIAAQNYEGGCTAHSMFRLPLNVIEDTGYWNLTNGSQRAQLIRAASLIIYDEAPMTHKYLINLLDRSLRDLMGCDQLFGGKLIIFAGDFRQIPPVVLRARCNNDIVQASMRTSHIWQRLVKFTLSQAQRTRGDQNYSEFLLRLGSGQCELHAIDPNHRTMLSLENAASVVTELSDLIDFVFPTDDLNNPDLCARRAILSTHNANVKEINGRVLERVEGGYIHCFSVDTVEAQLADEFYLGPDTLNRVQASGVPDHDLTIKIGSVCMIIRNLSFVDRLVNGTKVIIVNVSPRLITVRKPGESEVYLIPRISFKTPIEPRSPIEIIRRQFPLQVCYAMTVHKSQGQTIDKVGVDLRSDVFSHGQLYVALGRVRDQQNIRVLINRDRIIDNIPYVNNVVINNLIN